jgi:hypothetical protein
MVRANTVKVTSILKILTSLFHRDCNKGSLNFSTTHESIRIAIAMMTSICRTTLYENQRLPRTTAAPARFRISDVMSLSFLHAIGLPLEALPLYTYEGRSSILCNSVVSPPQYPVDGLAAELVILGRRFESYLGSQTDVLSHRNVNLDS